MVIGYQEDLSGTVLTIEAQLSHAKDEINVEFMYQIGVWNLDSLAILLPDEIKELIRGITFTQYHIQPDKLI